MKNSCKRQAKKNLGLIREIKKLIRRKSDRHYVKWKGYMISHLIGGLI